MKKLLLLAVVMLAMVVSIGYAPITAAETVSIKKGVEISEPRFDTQKPNNSIAMQVVCDLEKGLWRRQLIPFNGATKSMVTDEMKKLVEQLVPDRQCTEKWDSYKFTIIYPAEGPSAETVAKSENVTARPVVAAAMPLPKIVAPAVEKTAATKAEKPSLTNISLSDIKISDIKIIENYRGPGSKNKSAKSFFATKWYKGQPQVICYNDANERDLPLIVVGEIINHLLDNQPKTNEEFADENHGRWEFDLGTDEDESEEKIEAKNSSTAVVEKTAETKTEAAPTTPVVAVKAASVEVKPDAELLNALKAKLTALEAAEVKRLADAKAEADKKAKTAPAPAAQAKPATAKKSVPVFSQSGCVDKLKELGYEGNDGIKKFQKKYALTADGEAGLATCAQLRNVLAACTDCDDKKAATEPVAPATK